MTPITHPIFRPETIEFLPELRQKTRRSTYSNLSFYYFDKGPMQSRRARPVIPVCSLFLNRGASRDRWSSGVF